MPATSVGPGATGHNPTVPSTSGMTQAAGKKQSGDNVSQSGVSWSLLGKMYGSQMLAYMVAIHDAKGIMDRVRHMRPGPSLHLPLEVAGMNIWQVLQGSVQPPKGWRPDKPQQHHTSETQPRATTPQALSATAAAADMGRPGTETLQQHQNRIPSKPCSPNGNAQVLHLCSTAAAAVSSSDMLVTVSLIVLQSGDVQVLIHCGINACPQARGCSQQMPGCGLPQGTASGHTQQTHHVPTAGEVHAAVLSVLQAYIHTYLSHFSLQAFLEKQQQLQAATQAQSVAGGAGDAAWEGGSIAASAVTRTTKVTRKAPGSIVGVAIGNGDPVSYAMSSTSNTIKAALAARQAYSTAGSCREGAAAATAGTGGSAAVACIDVPGSPTATTATPATPPATGCANASRPGAGKSLSYAHTGTSGGGGRGKSATGGYAASVWGESAWGWDSIGDDASAANNGPDELNMHGVMLLCREVGLIDNITEHLDIIRCFELVLHRKRGRLGPAGGRQGPSDMASNAATATESGTDKAIISGVAAGNIAEPQHSNQQPQPGQGPSDGFPARLMQLRRSSSPDATSTEGASHEPDMLLVVHVVRPGVPAAGGPPAAAADGSTRGSKLCKPGSAAASRVLTVESLTAEEVLELLLLIMKERHPCYRPQPELLLRMLAAWHIALLQFRKPERGPPWLLRQVLQLDLLRSIESPATTEMLHGIYVHLAGSSANPQDLSMNLSDIRLGLKHAAGFRTQQDLPQLMQKQRLQQQQKLDRSLSNQRPHGNEASTQSSKGRSVAQGMYVRTDSGTLRNGAVVGSSSDTGSSGSCKRQFHLPLQKVAEFLRAAKLLPRLFDKYIAQLQRQGEEQKVRVANRGLPVMPSLRASVYFGIVREWRGGVHGTARHRSALKGSTGMTRLATLQESSSDLSGSMDGLSLQSQQQQQQQRPSLDGSSDDQHSMAVFLESSASLGASGLDAVPSLARPVSGRMGRFNLAAAAPANRLVGVASQTQTKPHDSVDGSTGSGDSTQQAAVSAEVGLAGAADGFPAAAFAGSKSGMRQCSAPLVLRSTSRRISGEYTGRAAGTGAADSSTRAVSMKRGLSRQSSTATAVGGTTGAAGSFVLSDKQQQPAGMMPDGQLDAALLDTAELVPVRAKAASIVIGPDAHEGSYSITSKRNRASGPAQVLQLPSPQTYVIQKGRGATGLSAGVGKSPTVHNHGDAVWQELLKRQKAGKQHSKGGKMSYEQQQELLKQELQVAEADAAMLAELATARQDTWTVFVLVELLGSHLVTPSWCNPVQLPASCDSAAHTVLPDAAGSTGSTDADGSTSQSSVSYCSWNNGYVYTTAEDPCSAAAAISGHAAVNTAFAGSATNSRTVNRQYSLPTAAAGAAAGASSGNGTSCGIRSGVPVDVMGCCITYPQFVEVLLCLMAGRATNLLEPDVKQLRSLTLDEEMQDHANVVLERIKKWRAVQLTPWKAKPATGNSANASSGPANVSHTGGHDVNGAKPADIQGPVARVYTVYSSMQPGSSCLGLHMSGFLQMLADARVFTESEFTAAGAAQLFTSTLNGTATTTTTATTATAGSSSKQRTTAAKQLTTVKDGAAAVAGSASAGTAAAAAATPTRALLGADNRQSTFMRSVTHQLLERLAVSATPETPMPTAACTPAVHAAKVRATVAEAAEVELHIGLHASLNQVHDDMEALQPNGAAALLPWQQQLQNCTTVAVPVVDASVISSQDGMLGPTDLKSNRTDTTDGQTCMYNFSITEGAPGDSARLVKGQDSRHGTCHINSAAASERCASSNSRSDSCSRGTIGNSANTSNATGDGEEVLHSTRNSTAASTSSSSSGSASSSSTSTSSTDTMVTSMKRPIGQVAGALCCCSSSAVLSLQQFQEALVVLSRKCFPRISNAARAWKLLIDRHIQPLADRKHSRYDAYRGSLSTPGVTALLTAWQDHLQQLFDAALATQNMQLPAQQQQQQRNAVHAVLHKDCDAGMLQLESFLEFLQSKATIPQLLEPSDVQEVLKRLIIQNAEQAQVLSGLSCSAFTQALAMCSLAVFAARRLQSSPLKQPEQQVAAFLSYLGLPPLPGQQQLLAVSAVQQPAGQQRGSFKQRILTQLSTDPYKEWWSLEFDPAAESRAHDHLSSLTYMPVMLEEAVLPPSCCPAEVLPLLSAAQAAHQARQVDDALALYGLAEEAWRDYLLSQHQHQQHQQQPRWELEQQADMQDVLPAAAVLYLSAAVSSCLLTGGRDHQAWEVLQSCEGVLADIHEAGADAALWHAAAGVALYHCEDLQAAFEHCVRAYVTRGECAPLGAGHPDTAAAGHNLGVVLDCLGKSSRGLELVGAAQQVFASSLGPNHFRSLVAARNAQHIKHKLIKLPAEPQELLQHSQAAIAAAAAGKAGRPKVGPLGLASRRPAASKGRKAGSINKAAQKGANSAKRRSKANTGYDNASSSESSGLAAGTSSESDTEQRGNKGRAAAEGAATKKAGARGPVHSRLSVQCIGSMKERLTAVMSNRQQHIGKQHQQQEWREYTDLDHLGSGVFRASHAQRALYEAVKPDIEAHTNAGSYSMSWSGSTAAAGVGVVEMQVSPGVLPLLHASCRQGSASPALHQQRPVSPAASGAVHGTVPLPQISAAGGVAATTGAAGESAAPLPGQLMRRGPLQDATIATVKKPLTIEEARQLRRQQMLGNQQKVHDSLLDKLY